jgi:zinc/manganese transport system permease protein
VLSVCLALLVTGLGEAAAYFSVYPIGFWVTSFAFALYLAATGYRALADRRGPRPARAAAVAA